MSQSAYDRVLAFNAGREPERLALKLKAMRAEPFRFLRGACHLFYARMSEAKIAPDGPAAWCCGDLHLENFGTYCGDNGLTYFDLNDFDEGVLAPAGWDIVRLATSVLVAAPGLAIKKADALDLARRAIEAYRAELALGKARWIERRTSDGVIGDLMGALARRDPAKFLNKRTLLKKGARQLIVTGDKMLPIADKERGLLADLMKTCPAFPDEPRFFKLIDAARRIAGIGSLGLPRYVLLVEGFGSPDDNLLLDLKAAIASAVVPFSPCKQPAFVSQAHRVAAVQTRCQAITPNLLRAVTLADAPFLLKELQPTGDRLDLAAVANDRAAFGRALDTMGALSAWSQLRSAGRGGADNADALIAFAGDKNAGAAILKTARQLEATTLADWQDYSRGYDGATDTADKQSTAR